MILNIIMKIRMNYPCYMERSVNHFFIDSIESLGKPISYLCPRTINAITYFYWWDKLPRAGFEPGTFGTTVFKHCWLLGPLSHYGWIAQSCLSKFKNCKFFWANTHSIFKFNRAFIKDTHYHFQEFLLIPVVLAIIIKQLLYLFSL